MAFWRLWNLEGQLTWLAQYAATLLTSDSQKSKVLEIVCQVPSANED